MRSSLDFSWSLVGKLSGALADELVGARRSLLANDEDAEGATLTAALVVAASNGALTLNTDGTFVYEHDGSETVSDSFAYAASDGTNMSEDP